MSAATYVIEQRGSEWCLLTHDRSRVLGCHPTKDGAEAQEAAVQARTNAEKDLFTLPGVEIFKAGKWNGDEYSTADLDAMVEASQQIGFTPPLKAGHADKTGEPAIGWVENLRRVGSSLYADLVSLPKKVYDAIKQRAYDAVSAEIFWDLERNGKKYPRVLKGLALLGAEVPAVDLQPLHAFLSMPPWPALPSARFAAYSVELGTDVVITRELMAKLCPSCAETMTTKKITRLKIPRLADGNYDFEGAFKSYEGFSDALCAKFSPAEGFRTRCMPTMADDVEDEAAFCNALKQWCGLMAERTRAKAMADDKDQKITDLSAKVAELQQALATRDGEITVSVAELREMQQKIADLEGLKPRELEAKLKQKETELDEVAEAARHERIRGKVAGLKVPALRAFARIFYELALETGGTGAKTYTLPNDPKKPISAESVVDLWIEETNRKAALLFQTFSTAARPAASTDEPEEIGERIKYRVEQYIASHKLDPIKDRKKATEAVYAADPELREEYARS